MTERARLTVVAGFLGAGKSTWLRHHLAAGVFAGASMVVNEAAATPVDDLLLAGAGHLAVLAGGCACCERREDLVMLLRRLCAEPQGRPPRIVLETSGLADPGAIVEAVVGDAVLSAALAVSEVVVLVGAAHGLDMLRREPLARRQVTGADCLIVTKLDAADADTTARLAAALAVLNPAAPLFGAVRGVEAPLPSDPALSAAALPDLLPEGDGARPHAAQLELGDTGWPRFSLWLSALLHARGPDILRIKGVVPTPAGRLLLQAVGGVLEPPVFLPGPPRPDDGTLVVIGRGFASADLGRSLEAFARTPPG